MFYYQQLNSLISSFRFNSHFIFFQVDLGQPVPACPILDFIGAKDDGGGDDNWSYKTRKVPVKSSPPTNQNPTFYKSDALSVAQPC